MNHEYNRDATAFLRRFKSQSEQACLEEEEPIPMEPPCEPDIDLIKESVRQLGEMGLLDDTSSFAGFPSKAVDKETEASKARFLELQRKNYGPSRYTEEEEEIARLNKFRSGMAEPNGKTENDAKKEEWPALSESCKRRGKSKKASAEGIEKSPNWTVEQIEIQLNNNDHRYKLTPAKKKIIARNVILSKFQNEFSEVGTVSSRCSSSESLYSCFSSFSASDSTTETNFNHRNSSYSTGAESAVMPLGRNGKCNSESSKKTFKPMPKIENGSISGNWRIRTGDVL